MFGLNDNQENTSGTQTTDSPLNTNTDDTGTAATSDSTNSAVGMGQEISSPATPPPASATTASSTFPNGFTPPKPLQDVTAAPSADDGDTATSAPETTDSVSAASTDEDEKPFSPFDPTSSHDETTSRLGASPNDLVRIKQDALEKLSPLVDHLDQTPEERFRTTMMLIQATDDSSKIKDAYDIAQQIADEKVRAQALLDIVNEINYFMQQEQQKESET